ncbi:MAG: DUF5999 family protein [Actinomycetota bacterium]
MPTEAPSTPAQSRTHSCAHTPPCAEADAFDRDSAHVLVAHPEQGWSLLCNGVVLFEDTGELLPDGQSIAARRRELLSAAAHRKTS